MKKLLKTLMICTALIGGFGLINHPVYASSASAERSIKLEFPLDDATFAARVRTQSLTPVTPLEISSVDKIRSKYPGASKAPAALDYMNAQIREELTYIREAQRLMLTYKAILQKLPQTEIQILAMAAPSEPTACNQYNWITYVLNRYPHLTATGDKK